MQNALNSNFLFNLMFDDYKLTPTEFALYYLIRQIYFFWGETEGCYVSNEFFAEKLNISVSTAKRTIEKLRENGLITTHNLTIRGGVVRRYIFPLEDKVLTKNAEKIRSERENLIKKVSHEVQDEVQNDPRHEVQNELRHEVQIEPLDNIYILNNQSLNKKESKESPSTFKSETELDEVLMETYGGLFDQPSTPNGMKEFSAPTPNQPAGRPPSPDMDNSTEFLRGNAATIEDNPSEAIQVIGGEEEKSFSEKKHGERKKSLQVGFSADMMAAWNSIAGEFDLARITIMTDARLRHAKAAVKAVGGIDNWVEGIKSQLRNSPFHRGENSRGWRANFDYYTRTDKALAAYEARYDKPQPRNSFEAAVDILFGKEM